MTVLTRRDFIGLAAAAASMPALETSAQTASFVYASESHHYGESQRRDGRLVIGLLITSAPNLHLSALAAIKKKTRYRRAIRSGSNDAFTHQAVSAPCHAAEFNVTLFNLEVAVWRKDERASG